MDLQEIRKKIAAAEAAIVRLHNKAKSEGRNLNVEEETLVAQLEGTITANREELEKPQVALTVGGGSLATDSPTNRRDGLRIFGANEKKTYDNMFRDSERINWDDRSSTFYSSFFSGRFDPQFKNSLGESIPSSGGVLIPTMYAKEIFDLALEASLILSRCQIIPMNVLELSIAATTIGSHESSLYGGYKGYWLSEGQTITPTDPTFRKMVLKLKKLAGLITFSNELRLDSPAGVAQVNKILANGTSFEIDDALINGSGANMPLGMLNGGSVVEVDKEDGQESGTIVYENLIKMLSRLHSSCFKNAIWLAHPSTIPQILSLTIASGTAGTPVPVLRESDGGFTLLTKSVYFTEKVNSLGNRADVALVDPSAYIVGLSAHMQIDLDPYSKFTTDQTQARIITRIDGQPAWDAPLTLKDGTTKQSPFIVLGERS